MRCISGSTFNKRWTGLLLAYIFGISSLSHAKTLQAISIGDKVPEIFFSQMVNFNRPTAKISQFKGRPVIIDFWATWCTSCLNNFPHIDSMNRIFDGKVQFLLIDSKNTGDTREKIVALFDKLHNRPGQPNFSVPSAIGDTIADKLFEHTMIPHYVWIDAQGILRYVTASEELSYSNINDFLNGNKITVHSKKDIFNFDTQAPLFFPIQDPNAPVIKARVMITGYAEGLPGMSGGSVDSIGRCTRLFATNAPIMNLYTQAIPALNNFNPNQVIYHLDDPSAFKIDDWSQREDHFFCFEIISPPTSLRTIQQRMKNALDEYFNVKSTFEEQTILCYAIRNPNRLDSAALATLAITAPHSDSNLVHFTGINQMIDYLNQHSDVPIIDQTGVDHPINISLPKEKTNLQQLSDCLQKFGFSIDSLQQKMKVFVIQQQTENN